MAQTPAWVSESDEREIGSLRDGGNEGKGMLDFLSSWKHLEIPNKVHEVRPHHSKKVLKIPGRAKLML